jgi:hypothetical protein
MKTRNTTTKLIAMVMAVGMLAAIRTVCGAGTAEAVFVPGIRQTGVFSLAQGRATSAHMVSIWAGDERAIIVL